jgi:serine/threonine protein kinase
MKPGKRRPNLQLDMSASIEDRTKIEASRQATNKHNLNYTSIEIGLESVIFKNENFSVGPKCIKNTSTGERLTCIIEPNDLEYGDFIGSGASGSVHLAVYKPKGIVIAIKSINIFDQDKRKQFKNDVNVLFENKCPFLVHFYGGFFEEGAVKILLEYMNLGSLDRVIQMIKKKKYPQPCIPEPILAKMTQQILQGLLYLHKVKHQIHRDIKPANILVNTDGVLKLTDFGIAKTLGDTSDLSKTFVGTKNFMSPERIVGKEYSYSSDVWSLGLIIYEMASGIFPYQDGNDFLMQITKIVEGPEPQLPNNGCFSQELRNFVVRCLKKDPNERDSVIELCNHPWILQYTQQEDEISDWLAEVFN